MRPYATSRFLRSALLPALAVGAIALGTTGCGEDEGPGTLVVRYEFGGGSSCQDAGVEYVEATLDDTEYSTTAECDGSFEVRLNDVPAGRYSITLQGQLEQAIDGEPVSVVDNLYLADADRRVEVLGDTTVESDEFQLLEAPAQLAVAVNLGAFSCSNTGIDHFVVDAYEAGGFTDRILQSELPCDGEIDMDDALECPPDGCTGHRRVDDEDRVLDGDLVGTVEIQAQDAAGEDVGNSATFMFDPPGPGRPIRLTVTCNQQGCEGTGTPD